MITTTPPACVTEAASRIAGTALGPFIMGQRNVDLDALEQRIVSHVIKEMNYVCLLMLAGVALGPQLVVHVSEDKPKRARKRKSAAKKPG
jgi:hypothetical protein